MRNFFQAGRLFERVKNTLFPGTLEFRAKIFTVLAIAGFLISLSTALIGLANDAGAGNAAACGIAALLAVVLLVYSKRSGRYRLCYIITIAAVFISLFPFMFFSAGGYHSGMPSFFIFAVIFTIFMLEGRAAVLTALVELLIYAGLCVWAYYRPGTVAFFKTEGALLADVIFGFVTVILALGTTMFLQIRLYRNYQKELEAAREDALRLSRVKSAFLSSMSHEIRTPINVMLGMNEMILRTSEWEQEGLPPANKSNVQETMGYARAIESAGKTLMALVNNVLDMSRLESGKMELNEGPYKTAELVRELFVMEQDMAARKGLSFTVEADENLPSELLGDETRIKQVALNFLSNAFKYTEKGGVVLRVRGRGDSGKASFGSGSPEKFRLCIEVEDTGIGIREEQKPELFGVFTRLDTERQVEGSGLGLAIAKELTGLMGGSIGVESVWGKGSVFTVEIPQLVLKAETMGSWLGGEQAARREYGFTAPDARILVVDDNAENRELIRTLLERTTIQVDTVSGGAECLEAAQKETYHAVIMDYMMSGMDGIETFRRLRSLSGRTAVAKMPVIALTAHAEPGARFLDEGFAAYLAKPVRGTDLEEALIRILPPDLVRLRAAPQRGEPFKPKTLAYAELVTAMAEHGVLLEQGLHYFSADTGQYRKTAAMFLKNYPERKRELRELLEKRDWTGLRFRVHSLKSNARAAGARNLSETAARLETYCSNGMDVLIEGAAGLLFAEWEEMKQALELFIGESV